MPIRTLLLFACSDANATFSYQQAWPRAFARDPRFETTPVNLASRDLASRLGRGWQANTFRGDLVVVLHSAFSNACMVPDWMVAALARMPQPKVFFIGNEYKLMPEKMQFCDAIDIAVLVSQSQSPVVHERYRSRLGCAVAGIPNTGLDTERFRPECEDDDRPIDLGYRADDSPQYLGHRERREMAEFFQARAAAYGLSVDISLDPASRFDEVAWAGFLNRCKGQLGTEAGGDYFELDDRTRHQVNAYTTENPQATFEEIRARFFDEYPNPVPMRILSGRNVEAAGTRTAQVLFEGHYDGFFVADQHYIPLRKDFSDADEALRKFGDREFRRRVSDRAYDLVCREFTYGRLMDRVHDVVRALPN
jgi:hypothetical protein